MQHPELPKILKELGFSDIAKADAAYRGRVS